MYEVGSRLILGDCMRYRVDDIRRGGMAYVFLTTREFPRLTPADGMDGCTYGKRLAIKMFDRDQEELLELFEHELNVWLDLRVPFSVPLLSVTRIDGHLAALMPVYDVCLSDLLEHGRLPTEFVVECTTRVSRCLDAAVTRHGVLHLDIKPSNIMLDKRASSDALVADWGLARHHLEIGSIGGTLPYMSPERIRGDKARVQDDIYSVGMLMLVLLTATLPVRGENEQEMALAILSGVYHAQASHLLVNVQPVLRRIVLKCIEPMRSRRYKSHASLLRDLRRCSNGTS